MQGMCRIVINRALLSPLWDRGVDSNLLVSISGSLSRPESDYHIMIICFEHNLQGNVWE